MTSTAHAPAPPMGGFWGRLPLTSRAVVGGLLVGMIAANVWPLLLIGLGAPIAVTVEVGFLGLYGWWFAAAGRGPWRAQRRDFGRAGRLSGAQWGWGLVAALAFAATVHLAMVLLFRFVPFPATAFHRGYDFSFVPGLPMKWLACVVSALSAGVCEEVGFRGYMQRPLENRHGPVVAIAISSAMFMLLHLNKDWSIAAMTPIVLGAGILLGVMARAAGSLVFNIMGHWIMDIGLFAFWWTQIAGVFAQRPITETGVDLSFVLEAGAFAAVLAALLYAVTRLAKLRAAAQVPGG